MLFWPHLSWGRVCLGWGWCGLQGPSGSALHEPKSFTGVLPLCRVHDTAFDWTLFPSSPSEVSRQWKTHFGLRVMASPHRLPFPCGSPTNLSPATLQVPNSHIFYPSACISSTEFLFHLLFPKTLTGSTSTKCSTPKKSHHCFIWPRNLREIFAQSGLPDLIRG